MPKEKSFRNICFLKHNNNICLSEIMRLLGKSGCSDTETQTLDDELCGWLDDIWSKKTTSRVLTFYYINGSSVDAPDDEDEKAAFFIVSLKNFFAKKTTVQVLKGSRQEIYAGFYSSSGNEQSIEPEEETQSSDQDNETIPYFRWTGVLFNVDKEKLVDELKLHVASITLQEFALLTSYDANAQKRTYDQAIKDLAHMCRAPHNPEEWSFKGNNDYAILKNYLTYTFMKLYSEGKIYGCNNAGKYFNTGLFTPDYKKIYAVFKPNPRNDDKRMFFEGFFCEDQVARFGIKSRDDDRADYFTQPAMLIFNPSLPLDLESNIKHISVERLDRWIEGVSPEDAKKIKNMNEEQRKELLVKCIERAKREIQANYKAVVPHYYISKRVASDGKIQLLIPLRLRDRDPAFVALVLDIITDEKITQDGSRISVPVSYKANTCLTLDMAYKNARLIVRPGVDWLKPQNIVQFEE